MAVNQIPLSAGKASTSTVNISVAKTDTSVVASPADATDFRLLFTAGTNHGYYDGIQIQWIGSGTQAAHVIDIWETDSAGLNARIVESFEFAAMGGAISSVVAGTKSFLSFPFANLQAGVKVFISSRVVSGSCSLNATLRGGQFEAQ